jgi:hypothetical protein
VQSQGGYTRDGKSSFWLSRSLMRIESERGRLFGFSRSALAIDFTTAASASRETEETGLAFNV